MVIGWLAMENKRVFGLGILAGMALWMSISWIMTGPFIVWRISRGSHK